VEPGIPQDRAVPDLVSRGNEALTRGAWQEARELFEQALRAGGEAPEALEGLGQASWWLDDIAAVAEARERAYKLYRERGDARGAARLALALAEDALIFRGEEAVMNGWTERARRLLADLEPSLEHALLAIRDAFFAFMLAGDMDAARRSAAEGVELARGFGVIDLEMYARAIDGVARVTQGFVGEGMRILDEATAAATSGEMRDVELIGYTCCFMIYGCERVRDFPRAAQWCQRVREFSERNGLVSLLGVCRNHYAMVLALSGAWSDAEAELNGAADQLALRPAQAAEGVARLGELRRRQGRLEEAERLFDAAASLPEAQIGRGLLALDLGDHPEAANIGERLLRQLPESDRLQRIHAYELVARARASLGELEEAREALSVVEAAASDVGTMPMRAAAALVGGAVALASREPNRARALFEDAIDLYTRTKLPYESAESRLMLARTLMALSEHDRAEAESTRAAEDFGALGAAHMQQLAAAVSAKPAPDTRRGVLTRREAEILALVGAGLSDKAIAERLTISEHTVHRHISNILTKLGVSSRAAATAQAAKLGLF
jgi:LuxR family transcriptional regulator, maltose regulon positive regulatory protein